MNNARCPSCGEKFNSLGACLYCPGSHTISGSSIETGDFVSGPSTSSAINAEIKASQYSTPTILSFELVDGRLEVVKRVFEPMYRPGIQIRIGAKVWKEVYGAERNSWGVACSIVLLKTIPAIYHPSQPESWEFEE